MDGRMQIHTGVLQKFITLSPGPNTDPNPHPKQP